MREAARFRQAEAVAATFRAVDRDPVAELHPQHVKVHYECVYVGHGLHGDPPAA